MIDSGMVEAAGAGDIAYACPGVAVWSNMHIAVPAIISLRLLIRSLLQPYGLIFFLIGHGCVVLSTFG